MHLHVETDTGNDMLMVGVPGSIIFRADSSEGFVTFAFTWPIVYRFSNGNIIGPLSESENIHYSSASLAAFESVVWHAGYGAAVTDPDTTLSAQLDFGGAEAWDSSAEVWRITFQPSDTGVITIDTGTVAGQQLVVIAPFGNNPATWEGAVVHVVPFCPISRTGDLTADQRITSQDIIHLVNFVFRGGVSPVPCEAAGDADCSFGVDLADILLLVDYVFRGGPTPCNVCSLIASGAWACQ